MATEIKMIYVLQCYNDSDIYEHFNYRPIKVEKNKFKNIHT